MRCGERRVSASRGGMRGAAWSWHDAQNFAQVCAPSGRFAASAAVETARVFLRQGGKDIVPYIDVVSVNYRAEAYFSGVVTGYELNIYAVNMSEGYYQVLSDPFKVQEDGNSAFTYNVQLKP